MRCHQPVHSTITLLLLGTFIFTNVFAATGLAAPPECPYDTQAPDLDHAVQAFMDPAMFACAEQEIRDVLQTTPLADRAAIARGHFLLAGALFGQTLTGDVPQPTIVEQLVLGFLTDPDWDQPWYFEDMTAFTQLVPVARETADSLLACPYDPDNPSPDHARDMMERYGLYSCAAEEASAAIDFHLAADQTDSMTMAESHFVLGQAYYGMRLIGAQTVSDSVIVDHLTTGFVITWESLGNWIFDDREDFVSLTQQARMLAEEQRDKPNRTLPYILAGAGAAVIGAVVAIFATGDDDAEPVDTIPSFPQPPGQ